MKKLFSFLFFITGLCSAFAQNEASVIALISCAEIDIMDKLIIKDSKYDDQISRMPEEKWNFYDRKLSNKIILSLSPYCSHVYSFAFQIRIRLLCEQYDNTNTLTRSCPVDLIAEHTDDKGNTNMYAQEYCFSEDSSVYKFAVTVSDIQIREGDAKWQSVDPQSLQWQNIRSCLELQCLLEPERYYKFHPEEIPELLPHTENTSGQLSIGWKPLAGAVYYEVDWLWVDDCAGSGTLRINPDSLFYDFDQGATRIRTLQNQYQIPLIFGQGYLIYRVRGCAREREGGKLYGRWSLHPSQNDIPFRGPEHQGYFRHSNEHRGIVSELIAISYEKDRKSGMALPQYKKFSTCIWPLGESYEATTNWLYVCSFDETGRIDEKISYFDNAFRERQSITRKGGGGEAHISVSCPDRYGRPALQSLSAPGRNTHLRLRKAWNKNGNSEAYSWKDFDYPEPLSCLPAASAMDSNSGASYYYSSCSLHDINAAPAFQEYVPHAQGYPFNHTLFYPDKSGRIYKIGGVGKEFQIGSGHESTVLAGAAEQKVLDALFGSNAGSANHYKKVIHIDPNGQVHLQYLDKNNRPVISGLGGEAPGQVEALNDLFHQTEKSSEDIGRWNRKSRDSVFLVYAFSVTTPGRYKFTYRLDPENYADSCLPENICLDCVYELYMGIFDRFCGSMLWEGRSPLAATDLYGDTCLEREPLVYEAELYLERGDYLFYKSLKLSAGLMESRKEKYLKNNFCLADTVDFIEYKSGDCALDCDACRKLLEAVWDSFVFANKYINLLDSWQDILDTFMKNCSYDCVFSYNPCEMIRQILISDMIPGAQYAETDPQENTESVFTTMNALKEPWRYPEPPYHNENGQRSVIEIDGTLFYPEELESKELFLEHWQNTWGESLIRFHPEYSCLIACQEKLNSSGSNAFDALMLSIDHFDKANDLGLFAPLGTLVNNPLAFQTSRHFKNTSLNDPYYIDIQSHRPQNDFYEIYDKMQNYSNGHSIWNMAIITATCPEANSPAAFTECLNDFSPDKSCYKNRVWKHFRNLYLSLKQENIYSKLCNPHIQNKLRTFSYRDQISQLQKTESNIDQEFSVHCNSICSGYIDHWMKALHSCSCTEEQKRELIDQMLEICKSGCDEAHPFGSSGCPPGIKSSHAYSDFSEAIAGILEKNAYDTSCSALKISWPPPYSEPGNEGNADICACEKIINNNDYADITDKSDLPVHTEINFADYEDALCFCRSLSAGNDPETACIYLHDQAAWMLENKIYLPVPDNLHCKTCFSCDHILKHIAYFEYRMPFRLHANNSEQEVLLLHQYLYQNHIYGLHHRDILAMLDSCSSSSQNHCPETPGKVLVFTDLLDKILEGINSNYVIKDMDIQSEIADLLWPDCEKKHLKTQIISDNKKQKFSVLVYDTKRILDNITLNISSGKKSISNIEAIYHGRLEYDHGKYCIHALCTVKDEDNEKHIFPVLISTGMDFQACRDFAQDRPSDCNEDFIISKESYLDLCACEYYNQAREKAEKQGLKPNMQAYWDYIHQEMKGSNQGLDIKHLPHWYQPCTQYKTSPELLEKYRSPEKDFSFTGGKIPVPYMYSCNKVMKCNSCQDFSNSVSRFLYDHLKTGPSCTWKRKLKQYLMEEGYNQQLILLEESSRNCHCEAEYVYHCNNISDDLTGFLTWAIRKSITQKVISELPLDSSKALWHNMPLNPLKITTHKNEAISISIYDKDGLQIRFVIDIPEMYQNKCLNTMEFLDIKPIPLQGEISRFVIRFLCDEEILEFEGGVEGMNISYCCSERIICRDKQTQKRVSDCNENHNLYAPYYAILAYERYLDSISTLFENRYKEKCLSAVEEIFFHGIEDRYHFTLYYYDQAGNLIRTVPPQGVRKLSPEELVQVEEYRTGKSKAPVYPKHILCSDYQFNSLSNTTLMKHPDAGISQNFYDFTGRLLASQNDKQKKIKSYTYYLYDSLGRFTERGLLFNSEPFLQEYSFAANKEQDKVLLQDYLDWVNKGYRQEVTENTYDRNRNAKGFREMSNKNCRNRISSVSSKAFKQLEALNEIHYAYDIHGNVKEMVQHNKSLEIIGQSVKTMEYEYDLISGELRTSRYQRNKPDEFNHLYQYDEQGRINKVYISRDKEHWHQQALYQYYKHGPLAKCVLGEHEVQGLDYMFTLQGWLKGINGIQPSKDAGKDGLNGNYRSRDVYSFTLGYFQGDYESIGGSMPFQEEGLSEKITRFQGLYNGNIRYSILQVNKLNSFDSAFAQIYSYDQLQRLISMESEVLFSKNASYSVTYATNYSYDANGNILKLNRYAEKKGLRTAMDMLTYHYKPNTNQLEYVDDPVHDTVFQMDIDDQKPGNYSYDETGNLISDTKEGIQEILWNNSGKISGIDKENRRILYEYDPLYNRNEKTLMDYQVHYGIHKGQIQQAQGHIRYDKLSTDFYVRDMEANILALYTWEPVSKEYFYVDLEEEISMKKDFITALRSTVGGLFDTLVIVPFTGENGGYEQVVQKIGEKKFGDLISEMIRCSGKDFSDLAHHKIWKQYRLSEFPVYGSDRLGTYKAEENLLSILVKSIYNPFNYELIDIEGEKILLEGERDNYYRYKEGKILYELKNHLGNVLCVINDQKVARDSNNDNRTDYFEAYEVSVSDYYPFGMEMPGRNWSLKEYMWGFQGQEQDDELKGKGNSVYFKYRIHDPRLGRFFSVDPLRNKYPWNSSYAFAENRLTDGIELEGLEWKSVKDDNGTVINYNWVGEDGYYEDGKLKDGIVEAAVIFWGSENEKLGEGDKLFDDGANLATAIVYGPDGPDDIEEYEAYTMSSDASKYGTVADGTYYVNYDATGKSGVLKSNWAVEGRGRVPARGGTNPAFPKRVPGYLTGVFIHRSNNSSYAGGGVSKGCLLIVPSYNNDNNGWDEFNQQLDGVSNFEMTINRDYQAPLPKFNFDFTVPPDNTYVAPTLIFPFD